MYRIFSISTTTNRTKPVEEKIVPFVVVNTDRDNGYYINRLLKAIQRAGLEEFAPFDDVSLTSIEPRDIIVFGESKDGDYDVRVVDNYKDVDELDGRRFKSKNIFNLVDDFPKVMKALERYVAAKKSKRSSRGIHTFPVYAVAGGSVEILCAAQVEQWRKKKVTIFTDWVKIGTDVYDIYVDMCGNEFIKYHGIKLYIHENWLNQKYLADYPVV